MKQRFTAPVAIHLFFLKRDQILLLRRANTGYEDGKYSVVAGHLDGGEEVVQAAIREAKEETGVHVDAQDVRLVGVMHRREGDERIDFFAVVERWEGEICNLEPQKCDDLRWFSLNELPPNTIPYIRRAIANYLEGRWFDSYGWNHEQNPA